MSDIPNPERNDPHKIDPRLPGDDQGVANRPGFPEDDDDELDEESGEEIDEVSDPRAEPGKPI